jgi:hypothetical protein
MPARSTLVTTRAGSNRAGAHLAVQRVLFRRGKHLVLEAQRQRQQKLPP